MQLELNKKKKEIGSLVRNPDTVSSDLLTEYLRKENKMQSDGGKNCTVNGGT
jgi:hypothetical protein